MGDTARAAVAFKNNLVRVERLEAEQKATEERAIVERPRFLAMCALQV